MHCWTCGTNAAGTCRFCGRGVCAQHVRARPFVVSMLDDRIPARATVVDDALHCGHCTVRTEGVAEVDAEPQLEASR